MLPAAQALATGGERASPGLHHDRPWSSDRTLSAHHTSSSRRLWRVNGDVTIRSLEGEQACTPSFPGDPRALGSDDVGRLMREVSHHLTLERGILFGEREARMTDRISPKQFHEAEGVEEWRVLGDGACAYFRTGSFAAGARLVQAISALPGVEDHQPDVDLRYNGVTVRLLTKTDDYYGMSRRDLELARRISAAARALGLAADPSAVQSLLVIPGATATAEVMPFWRAVLGYEPRPDSPDEDLVDPRSRGPSFWFEQMKEPRADGGGAIHVAIWVPHERAEARIAAALAAGGRMVRDEFAPSWWTLADTAGNEADIATTMGRD